MAWSLLLAIGMRVVGVTVCTTTGSSMFNPLVMGFRAATESSKSGGLSGVWELLEDLLKVRGGEGSSKQVLMR